jgi:ATP-binding cassette, subfamily A (ABC1), member 3
LANKLRKVYRTGKVAVDQVSFGLKQGEVFGLLGVNGAGKTSTFKMLTSDVIPTSGKAFINSFDLGHQQHLANQFIGYCP